MDIARARTHRRGDDIGERARGRDRRGVARLDDGAGDGARVALLAENENDSREVALARRVDDIGPSRRKEKPRSAVSSCMEETPRSSTTPSAVS
jgi:hypothetical protein